MSPTNPRDTEWNRWIATSDLPTAEDAADLAHFAEAAPAPLPRDVVDAIVHRATGRRRRRVLAALLGLVACVLLAVQLASLQPRRIWPGQQAPGDMPSRGAALELLQAANQSPSDYALAIWVTYYMLRDGVGWLRWAAAHATAEPGVAVAAQASLAQLRHALAEPINGSVSERLPKTIAMPVQGEAPPTLAEVERVTSTTLSAMGVLRNFVPIEQNLQVNLQATLRRFAAQLADDR